MEKIIEFIEGQEKIADYDKRINIQTPKYDSEETSVNDLVSHLEQLDIEEASALERYNTIVSEISEAKKKVLARIDEIKQTLKI